MARDTEKTDLKELVNNLHVGVYRRKVGVRGKIMFVNSVLRKMLNYKESEMLKMVMADIFSDRKQFRTLNEKISCHGYLKSEEVLLRDKNGNDVWCTLSSVIVNDNKSKPKWIDGVVEDISEKRKVEKDLKESRELFRTVFNNTAAAITVTDKNEKIMAWNPFAEKMLEMTQKDLFNKPVKELYPKKEWRKIRGMRIRQKGVSKEFDTQVYKRDGAILHVNMSITVLRDPNGNMSGAIGIMRDITEQKKSHDALKGAIKTAEEASYSKSMFLANMSHEVRTPMNTILGMVDLTLDTDLNAEQRENLKTAKDAADNLLSLLNDILDLSRVEAGKINLEIIEINLHNLIKSVCKGLTLLAKKKSIELVWEVDQDIPLLIGGDPVRLRQVLVNLINNAIKFTFKGKIQVSATIKSSTDDEYEIIFSVADQGIGIPKDKKDKIFDIFTQADDSTTRKYGGTGLGLAISKKLVEIMGGDLWVESQDLKGSTFYFSSIFKKVKRKIEPIEDITEELERKLEETRARKEVKNIHILLAEDNIVNQKIAVKLLEKKGWAVKAVDDGQKVIDLLAQEEFDVILMDAQMPVLDGLEATKKIRENEQGTGKRIPIIALTARAMLDDRKKCLDVGMDDYVSKPIDRQKLYDTVETIVYKRRNNE